MNEKIKQKLKQIIANEKQNYNRENLLKYADTFREHFMFIFIVFVFLNSTNIYNYSRIHEYMIPLAFSIVFLHIAYYITDIIGRFSTKFQRIIKPVLVFVLFFPWLMEVFTLYKFQRFLKTSAVGAIFETNANEAREFLHSHVDMGLIILLCVVAIIIGFLQYYKPWKKIKLEKELQLKIIRVYLVGVILSIAFLAIKYTQDNHFHAHFCPQIRVLYYTREYYENAKEYDEIISGIKNTVEITDNKSSIKNIVFILGESQTRRRMNLYGYSLPNTPKMVELKEKGELAIYKDTISPYAATLLVVRELFTFHSTDADSKWYECNNLIDVMNAAGYTTHWLSNQETSGVWGNISRVLSARCTEVAFTKQRDSRDEPEHDEKLFELIDKSLAEKKADKNFYVIHLMGCHQDYKNRYPESYKIFSATDIEEKRKESERQTIAEYSNVTLYNDYIIGSIIDKFRRLNEDTIIIYLSDHGEEVYDLMDFAGHNGDANTAGMFEIPFVVWGSDEFKKVHHTTWSRINSSIDRKYMTDDMIHTILDISEIKTKEWDSTRSIINGDFDESRERLINRDYDGIAKVYSSDMK